MFREKAVTNLFRPCAQCVAGITGELEAFVIHGAVVGGPQAVGFGIDQAWRCRWIHAPGSASVALIVCYSWQRGFETDCFILGRCGSTSTVALWKAADDTPADLASGISHYKVLGRYARPVGDCKGIVKVLGNGEIRKRSAQRARQMRSPA